MSNTTDTAQTTPCNNSDDVFSTQQHTLADSESVTRLTGLVKWFNNKPGFGFITVITPGEFNGNDIFVHYNNILTLNKNVYKTLTKGEYVEFTLQELNDDNKTYTHQAVDVTGPYLYKLMCENNPSKPRSTRRNHSYVHYNNPRYVHSNNGRHQGRGPRNYVNNPNGQFVYPNGQYGNNFHQ